MFKPASLIVIFLITCSDVTAAQNEQLNASFLAKAFVGGCVQIMPGVDRVEAGARALGWKELSGDMAKMLAPPDPKAKWKGWLVTEVGQIPYMIGVSRGEESGKSISVCTVANPYAPAEQVQTAVKSFLSLKSPLHMEQSGGQRTQIWKTVINGNEATISIIDATPMNDPGVNLSVMMVQ